jgi:hypothetical protein
MTAADRRHLCWIIRYAILDRMTAPDLLPADRPAKGRRWSRVAMWIAAVVVLLPVLGCAVAMVAWMHEPSSTDP